MRSQLFEVDQFGLDDMDSRILKAIIEKFGGGPVGVGTIAAAVGEDVETLEEVYEPFLVQNGFLQRTPRGRVATAQAYRHFGFNPPAPTNGGVQHADAVLECCRWISGRCIRPVSSAKPTSVQTRRSSISLLAGDSRSMRRKGGCG